MSDFNPTHEFRGLELKLTTRNLLVGSFDDEEGFAYKIPMSRVNELQELPKYGEVWQLKSPDDNYGSVHRLVNDSGQLVNPLGRVVWRPDVEGLNGLRNYVKVLNADGSPA